MRKVILGLAMSLDGYIEGPNGEYDWCFTDQDYGMSAFMERIDAILMGRKSFELVSGMGGENPWKGMTTYVYSNSLNSVSAPDTLLVSGNMATETRRIKALPGKDIWLFGGAQLTSLFIREKLVDELWLSVHPILLGSGKPLFQGLPARVQLSLLESKSYETGLVSLRYTLN